MRQAIESLPPSTPEVPDEDREVVAQQPAPATPEQLQGLMQRADIAWNMRPIGRLLDKVGLVGGSMSGVDLVAEKYGKDDEVKPDTALGLVADGLALLEPIGRLAVDRSTLGKHELSQYDYALGKLREAKQLKARLAADHPELSHRLVQHNLKSLIASPERGPLIVSDSRSDYYRAAAVNRMLYAGEVGDLAQARDQLTGWLAQNLDHVSNPKVQEVMDKLNARIAEEQYNPTAERAEVPLAA